MYLRLWANDCDYRIMENINASYTIMNASLKWWGLFADPYKWDEFIATPEKFNVLKRIEERSQNENSIISWKTYRRWRRSIKVSILGGMATAGMACAMPQLGAQSMPPRPKHIYVPAIPTTPRWYSVKRSIHARVL